MEDSMGVKKWCELVFLLGFPILLGVAIGEGLADGTDFMDKVRKEEAAQQHISIEECRTKGGIPLIEGSGDFIQLKDCKLPPVAR